ncbi:MAG: Homoserine O-acetyltransferase [bacterium ADurb.Bin236]|nr:MAG: Homoserine O-acetyltransferase [bacterium ADurb.Bin236]
MSGAGHTSNQGQAPAGAWHPANAPDCVGWTSAKTVRIATAARPFRTELGGSVGPVDVEYETYGELSAARDNVVLIAHALSGDAHVAGWDADAKRTGRLWRMKKPGWWDAVVGPGKAIDTRKYFVVCANVLGGCCGATGPSSPNPFTGKPYSLQFPMVTVGDWVKQQAALLDELGIERLHAVVGGSLGGQQAIEWAMSRPDRVDRCIVLAATPRLSTQGLAFNAIGRRSIINDPDFKNGEYYGSAPPSSGLAAARMLAHITYLSEAGMREKFGRRAKDDVCPGCGFGIEFEVESYLDRQGRSFVERFDANSYLYITRAMDYYDAAEKWGGGSLEEAASRVSSRVMAVSFDSDWLYPPEGMKEFAQALARNGKPVTYINVPSRYGHDAFLVETETVSRLLRDFLSAENGGASIWGVRPVRRETAPAPQPQPSPAAVAREDDPPAFTSNGFLRWQDKVIIDEIPEGASVLDLGCGDGKLLSAISASKGARGQGVEIDIRAALDCVGRNAPVFHGDIENGLAGFPDDSFDYVVLEETLQTLRRPDEALRQMLRIGRRGIVSFPNFANYRVVHDLMTSGRMPVGGALPYQWHETPNIHLFTLNDFRDWAARSNVRIVKGYALVADGVVRKLSPSDNMYAEEILVVVEKTGPAPEYLI